MEVRYIALLAESLNIKQIPHYLTTPLKIKTTRDHIVHQKPLFEARAQAKPTNLLWSFGCIHFAVELWLFEKPNGLLALSCDTDYPVY